MIHCLLLVSIWKYTCSPEVLMYSDALARRGQDHGKTGICDTSIVV